MIKRFLLAIACCLTVFGACADNVTFSYQGNVKVSNQPYTGAAQFKLAILDTSGATILWSNDGTMSGEPAAFISGNVTDSVFSLLVGDTNAGMQPINSAIFTSRTPLKLRVWFNANNIGFQQLNPDQTLVDLTLNTVSTGSQDFTLYVDGTNGNDTKNGLTLPNAKKTIQAALDTIPAQLRCNVTVKIMPGDYAEPVSVHGISSSGTAYGDVFDGQYLRIVGDETWTTASAGNPSVRLLGSNTPAGLAVRRYCLSAHNSSAVMFEGLWFHNAVNGGLKMETGNYIVKNCKASNSGHAGFITATGSYTNYNGCYSSGSAHGYYVINGATDIGRSIATGNTYEGIFIQGPGMGNIRVGTKSFSNTHNGLLVSDNAIMRIDAGVESTGNLDYGIYAHTGGVALNAGAILTGNTDGAIYSVGGHIY
jgi:hypothetical protein